MSFLSSLNISGSGMTAQRMRLDIAAQNISNMETTRTETGEPYRRKMVVLQEKNQSSFQETLQQAVQNTSGGGVQVSAIIEDQSEFVQVYNPEHPDANAEGYVSMPNIDLVKETTDAMSATRSYEANITAFNAIKTMAQKALEVGK